MRGDKQLRRGQTEYKVEKDLDSGLPAGVRAQIRREIDLEKKKEQETYHTRPTYRGSGGN